MTTQFVVALAAEAKPIIERFGLVAEDGPFRSYRGDGRRLVTSGVGKAAAAGATGWSFAEPLGVWLNVGIAGHRDREPGELVRAHRIVDHATGQRYYPALVGLPELASSEVVTVDRPESSFPTSAVYDMEASSFYATALRFSTSELVQCVKVVSDNHASGTDGLTSDGVSALIESRLNDIEALVLHLEALAAALAPLRESNDVSMLTERCHFTVSERVRLEQLALRLRALGRDPGDAATAPPSSKAVLDALEAQLLRAIREQRTY